MINPEYHSCNLDSYFFISNCLESLYGSVPIEKVDKYKDIATLLERSGV